nr:reverse transcriptase domain-containing protein [Tanacetum cinerariifolium]
MSTRSSARNLFPPLDIPEHTIRRRSHTDPTLLSDFEMADEGNDDPPVHNLQTMKTLCQPSLNGRGGPIAPIAIQATNFGLKNDMIQQVQNSCQFHGLPAIVGNTQNVYAAEAYQGITTRSGTAYPGTTIPTTTSSSPVVERETEATKDTVHPTNNRSTKNVQPPVVQTESLILNSEPVVAPIIEPVVALNDECLALSDLSASINLMPLSVSNKILLPDLSPTCMTLELADRLISRPVEVVEDVFVKVGTFHFPADFVVVDFDDDPRVPLILGRALIDVFEGELTLRVGKEAITFNLNQIQVLGYSDVIASGNPTTYYDPMVSTTSLTLTTFEENDFLLEEVDAFLALEDDPTSPEVDQYYELKIREAKSDKSSNDEPPEVKLKDLPPRLEYAFMEGDDKLPVIIAKDLSVEKKTALITVLKLHNHFMVKEGIVLGHKISKDNNEVDKAKVEVIAKLPHPTIVKDIRSFLGHAGFYRRFIKDFSKIAQPMIRLLEKDTPFLFSKECVEGFQTLKRKLTKALILIALNWDMTFELMCDANDFAIGVVLEQHQDKHFRPIHYVSIDFMGPFSSSRRNKYILIAVDYLSKWVEAKALLTNDARVVCKFLKNLFARFGFPRAIISDHETHFYNDQLRKVMLMTVGENHASWSDKLDDTLWAFRTAYKTPIGCTSYKLVYEKACHLPIELEHKAYWA